MVMLKNKADYKEILSALPEDQRVRKEFERITKFYKNLPEYRLYFALRLCGQAAYVIVLIADLRKTVTCKNIQTEYTNGANQGGKKTSPEFESYMRLSKEYRDLTTQLDKLLPVEERGPVKDGLDEFIDNR